MTARRDVRPCCEHVFVLGETKTCTRCGETQPVALFVWRRDRNRWGSHCKRCRADYGRSHYQNNKQLYLDRAVEQKRRQLEKRTRLLFEHFEENPCSDCGESDPVVLEFDHLRDKRFDISARLAWGSWRTIVDEIAKCEVVCANCHRRRTARRLGSIRAVLTGLTDGEL